MVTRLKFGIKKPRVLYATQLIVVPRTVKEVLNDSGWHVAITSEFDTLANNKTWILSLLLRVGKS